MLEEIVPILVVVGIFAVVVLPLAFYAWRSDPHHFALWASELRERRQAKSSSPRTPSARSEPADTSTSPSPIHRPSAPDRLQYWVEGDPDRRAPAAKRPKSARRRP